MNTQALGDAKVDLPAVLRVATRAAHHRIDHHPLLAPLLRPDLSLRHYARVLQTFLAFHEGWQPAATAALERLGSDFQVADRVGWLRSDVADIAARGGVATVAAGSWPLPPLINAPTLIGGLYVVEGSALGGQVIARHLQASLGIDAVSGARFFSGRGEATAQHWRHFWQFAATMCPPDGAAAAAAAAVHIFDTIAHGLDSALA